MPKITQSLNQEIIAYLRQKSDWPKESPISLLKEVSLSDLRTHPDYGQVFVSDLPVNLKGVTSGIVLGFNVLINSKNVIFAVAMGVGFVAFRLGSQARRVAIKSSVGIPAEGLSDEWVQFPYTKLDGMVEHSKVLVQAIARIR